ncbi:hypothetical protein AN401_07285 [Zobellella denitrificans]|uniref:VWFA domain-containing protein n=1 Tax=Zobellella denitrificans TaxID=347534 RepID=A0A291HN86_9GAMM|nr:VWA domain-containing protein [Zobellella denitrificans]ATG73686.1 hypothetical protein AN401_07285 [Zobellella denitrificans]
MDFGFFTIMAIALASSVLSFLLARKPQQMTPAAVEQLTIPTVHDGDSIGKLYGTKKINSAAVRWYGHVRTEAIVKEGGRKYGFFGKKQKFTVGYKYFGGIHFVLGLSHFDRITRIEVGDKVAWSGLASLASKSGYSRLNINQPNLFGGEESEGGIQGALDIGFGYKEQGRNSYLAARQGSDCPAYRGVMSVILRQMYLGTSPYIKPWSIWGQRIFVNEDGAPQWYPTKAAIGTPKSMALYIALDRSGSMGSGPGSRMENAKTAIISVLEGLRALGASSPIDIMFVAWSGSKNSILRRNIGSAGVEDVINFVGNITSIFDGTNFEMAVNDASGFFDGAGNKPRYVMFITDGEPNLGSVTQAAATLFSISGVRSYAFNIDLANTTETAKMDNTPEDGVPVVEGDDPGPLQNAIMNALFSQIDMNPVHIIREMMTDQDAGAQMLQSDFGSSWQQAADVVHAEGLGVSLLWHEEESVDVMVAEVIRHIDAIRYEDPETGLWEIKLIRGDYDPDTLPELNPSNSQVLEWRQTPPDELINQITVEFWNHRTGENDAITVQDIAAITQLGRVKNRTMQYLGFSHAGSALQAGQRDLAQMSRPFGRGKVRANRVASGYRPGDVFRLVDPDSGLAGVICRVAKVRDLALGHIELDVTEDVFGVEFNTYAEPGESLWEDPIGNPRNLASAVGYEAPYLLLLRDGRDDELAALPAGGGYYGYAGERPDGGGHLNYMLYVALQGDPAAEDDIADFVPVAELQAAGATATTLPLARLDGAGLMQAGTLACIGSGDWTRDEWVQIVTAPADDATELTVLRGVADTTPKPIPEGAILYAVEAILTLALDSYSEGQTVVGHGAPINSNGQWGGPFLERPVTMAARIERPYPPANLKVNGVSFPDEEFLDTAATFALTWNHRDRLVQSQTVVDWFESANYGPESGTTYRVTVDAYDVYGDLLQTGVIDENVGLVATYDADFTLHPLPAETVFADLQVWTDRGGEQSLQAATARIRFFAPPFDLTGEFIPD